MTSVPRPGSSPSKVVIALYRTVVRLAPHHARERFGAEQIRLFEQLSREERPRGRLRSIAWTCGQLWRAGHATFGLWVDHLVHRGPRDLTISGRAGGGWRVPVVMDVRDAMRTLWRAPWFSIMTISVLSVSVALVTTAFAVVDGVLFKPLPYVSASELHLVRADTAAKPTIDPMPVAGADLAAWAEAVPDLRVTGLHMVEPYKFEERDYGAVGVDERFFDVLGVHPIGGGFVEEDFDPNNRAGNPSGFWQPLIVSYSIWQRHFGGDPGILGKPVTLVARGSRTGPAAGYRIRGVLPRDFAVPLDLGTIAPEIVAPLSTAQMRADYARRYQLIVRVPPAVSPIVVRDRLLGATLRRAQTPPQLDPSFVDHHGMPQWRPAFDDVRLLPLAEHLGWRNRQAFGMVFGAAGVLLVLACVNIAGLAAGRSLDRRRELAVRRALGASTWAISRQLIIEAALLSALSTFVALWLARPLLDWTLALLPVSVALLKTPAIDARVFMAAALCGVTTVAIGVWWPARIAHRISLPSEFSRGGAHMTPLGRRSTFVLVASQVALGFVLLAAGGLTIASLATTWNSDAGYDRDHLIVMPAFVEGYRDLPDVEVSARVMALADLFRRTDGVRNAAANTQPLFWSGRQSDWSEVLPLGSPAQIPGVQSSRVEATYFDTLGLPLIEGRWPARGEWGSPAGVAIVSSSAARMFWPGQSAIGQVLVTPQRRPTDEVTRSTVIGVAGDARYRGLDRSPMANIYLPYPISFQTYGSFFVIRTNRPAGEMVGPLVAAAKANGFWVEDAASMRDALFASVRHRVLPAWLFGSLGAVALLILAAGILGLFVMSIARRTREMGIRVALGASTQRIAGLLIREQLRAIWLGLAVGAVISTWTVRGLASQLYGVGPYDPAVWSAVALVMVAIATLATLVPATRAARADPIVILRAE